MSSTLLRWSLLLLLSALWLSVFGQANPNDGPYHFSTKRELSYGGIAALTAGTGLALNLSIDDIALSELHLPRLSRLDRHSLTYKSTTAKTISDVTAVTSVSLPLLFLFSPAERGDAPRLALLFAETMLLNQGVSDVIKSSVVRPRPYLYPGGLSEPDPVKAYDRTSFPSAHTSNTAAACFFFGRVFADYHPDSKLRPLVWTVSATLPAVTGYLRVRGAQHFPTDVAAGYVLGAVIGYAVPALHRKPLSERRMSLAPTGNGVYLSYALR